MARDELGDWSIVDYTPSINDRGARKIRFVKCAGCGDMTMAKTAASAFCSQQCAEEAKFVRYLRNELSRESDPATPVPQPVIYAIRTKLAEALRGGYAQPRRVIPPKVRAAVWERDGDLCVICGAPGKEVDHLWDGVADEDFGTLDFLRLLCWECHADNTR